MVAAEVEHGQGDEGVGGLEAEGDAGDEADLGVDRFDAAVGQAMLDRGEDRGLVFDDAALQVDEGGDAAAAGQPIQASRAPRASWWSSWKTSRSPSLSR